MFKELRKMRQLLAMALVLLVCLGCGSASAGQASALEEWNSQMSTQAENEREDTTRWSAVLENEVGIYAYDVDSLHYRENGDGLINKNLVAVLTKTAFTNRETLKSLNEKYKDRLGKKEKVQYCEILMTFNIAEATYSVNFMDLYSNKQILLEHSVRESLPQPVPKDSFAEAMLEICRQAAANTEESGNAAPAK